jgi:DNA-directed RNA polymerase subunit L
VMNAKVTKVNIKELFTRFNNFGQQEITDKNLNGILTGTADVGFLFDKKWDFLPASLYAFLDIRIDAGELNQYEPMKALSRFIRVEDLENIRFSSLVNQIEIRDQTIFIPAMEIKNNALNMQLEGQHTFANSMNYSIRLQLKEVMAAKYAVEHEPDEFEKEEQGINIFLRMSGTPDKLSIRYDSKNARKSFKQEMK